MQVRPERRRSGREWKQQRHRCRSNGRSPPKAPAPHERRRRPGRRGRPTLPLTAQRDPFARIGDDLAVDFANTVYAPDRDGGSLRRWLDVVRFLAATDAVDAATATSLRGLAKREPERAAQLYDAALRLRATIRETLEALDRRRPVPAHVLERLNRILDSGRGREQLTRGARALELRFAFESAPEERALLPLARAAAALLADRAARVRKCGAATCIRYFRDRSRTGKRRWCAMAICGNRAKAAAFTRRRGRS